MNDLEGIKASEKRSEEIAVFDKLNDLLNEEKEFLKDRNINCVELDGAKVLEGMVKEIQSRLGVLIYGEN